MRIGIVDFLNAYPLCYGLEDLPDVELVREIPSRLSQMIQRDELDVALISSIEYHRHRDKLKMIPELCISSHGEVWSILLFVSGQISGDKLNVSPRQLIEFLQSGDSLVEILYDRATRSSLEILKILLGEVETRRPIVFHEVEPPHRQRINELGENEFLLLIGDQALEHRDLPSIDLGRWYYETFHLPTVYAVWAINRNSTNPDPAPLILNAWRKSQASPERMLESAVRRFNFPADLTRRYLTEVIGYEMGPEEERGLEFFFGKSG